MQVMRVTAATVHAEGVGKTSRQSARASSRAPRSVPRWLSASSPSSKGAACRGSTSVRTVTSSGGR